MQSILISPPMADSNDFFSYDDADAFLHDEDTADFLNNLNFSFSDINEELRPMSYSPELPQEIKYQVFDVDNDNVVYSEPMVQDQDVGIHITATNGGENLEDCLSQDQGRNFEAGPSQVNMETPPPAENNMESTDFSAHVNDHPSRPPRAKPFYCTYCVVLREIIHTNGAEFTTFEIHGGLGFICHGIRHQNIVVGFLPNIQEYQMIDFKKKSIDEVKSTLMQYCLERNQAGYVLVADPLSSYYETLSIGLDWTHNLPDNQNPATSVPNVEPANYQIAPLKAQRERVGRLSLKDFSDYFHLPIDEAAKLVGICPTVVKKICRRDGLNRWPYRKVKSIVKQISASRKSMESADEAFRTQTEANIDALLNEIVRCCGGIAPTSLNIE